MKRTIILAAVALTASLGASAQIITTGGIGQIALGSSKEQIKAVATGAAGRDIFFMDGYAIIMYKGAELSVWCDDFDNRAYCLSTDSRRPATREGLKVGSTLGDLKRIYGSKISMKDGEMGELFAIYGSKGGGQILFELGDRKVVNRINIVKDSDEYFGF